MISLCKICFNALKLPENEAQIITQPEQLCPFCFGILMDYELCQKIANKVAEEREIHNYDGNTFVMALNTPISMHLREVIMQKALLNDNWVPLSMSPKQLFSNTLMSKIGEVNFL